MNSKLMGISRRKWLSRTVASLALASGLPVSAQTGSIESVVILAFTAFGCGFSAQADAVLRAIKAKYGARVQVRYKFLPLDDGANTMMLHEVALFAGNQGNQNEMVSLLHALGDKSDFLDLKAAVFNKLSLGCFGFGQNSFNNFSHLIDSDFTGHFKK